MEIIIGNEYRYCNNIDCIVIKKDSTHVLIKLNNSTLLATPHSLLDINYKN
jgi:hypothetical protein